MRIFTRLLALLSFSIAAPASAQEALEAIGKPTDKALGFQKPVTELMRDIIWLDNMLLWMCALIVLFVCILLGIVIFRFNSRANPTPSSFTHNTPVEIVWTLGPVLILMLIGAFSLPVLFKQQIIPEGDITIKATGNQWNWSYEYVDEGFEFTSFLVDAAYQIDDPENGWGADQPMGQAQVLNEIAIKKLEYFGYAADEFLLATDVAVVVPVNKVIVVQVTGSDVIHSWAIPAFGVKQDGVPGRLAQLWFKAEEEGIYFGQCSELCGKDHAYMPITVKVVSDAAYAEWLAGAKAEYAGIPASVIVASAD